MIDKFLGFLIVEGSRVAAGIGFILLTLSLWLLGIHVGLWFQK